MQAFLRKTICWSYCLICLGGLAISSAVFAITPEEAASIVRSQTDGRVLDAKHETVNNQEVYLIKVITDDSRVIIVRVDATTGQILQ